MERKRHAKPNEKLFPSMSREKLFSGFRNIPMKEMLKSMDPDGMSVVHGWDMEVYIGVMERIENWFQWNDLHWSIPKAELIQRTKEWNTALSQYCDDKGLSGMEREQVVQVHTASALARCSNPACGEFEVKVKGFAKCSRCKQVAYCSTKCQTKHWKLSHRNKCLPVNV